jgi:5-dehydro-2-deoxygluconokinase
MASKAGVPLMRLRELKRLISIGAKKPVSSAFAGLGFIVDDQYGSTALRELTGQGFWIARPIEQAGAPSLSFIGGPSVALTLETWPVEHVVKCLCTYHPQDPEPRRVAQEGRLVELAYSAEKTGHELLLEIIPRVPGKPSVAPGTGSMPPPPNVDTAALPQAMARMYDLGIRPDWWKLPPPTDPSTWGEIDRVIEERDPWCRGVLLLGLDAPESEVAQSFQVARASKRAKGFAIGRTIFSKPAAEWLEGTISDRELIERVSAAFSRMIELFKNRGDAWPG